MDKRVPKLHGVSDTNLLSLPFSDKEIEALKKLKNKKIKYKKTPGHDLINNEHTSTPVSNFSQFIGNYMI